MKTITFIGGGNMARALIGSLHARMPEVLIQVVDPDPTALSSLVSHYGCAVASTLDEQWTCTDVIILAVKPYVVREVCATIAGKVCGTVISIAAGLRVETIERWLGGNVPVIRSMPNTPALARAGMTGLYASKRTDADGRRLAERIFSSVGKILWCDEEAQIDTVTAISGSGPAYVFYFIEALSDAAHRLGFSREAAAMLARATFNGAAALLEQSDDSAETLRVQVTSRGGTTAAAIASLERRGVANAVIEAVEEAHQRAIEIGSELAEGTW